jgi:hypothetical protein
LVAVDESAFRQRLADVDLATRLTQRRATWRSLLAEASPAGQAPIFVDLGQANEAAP